MAAMSPAEAHAEYVRGLRQRRDALARANAIRTARAALKRILSAERNLATMMRAVLDPVRGVADVELQDEFGDTLNPPADYLEAARVFDLLVACRGIGRIKANRLLAHVRIPASKALGALTERQRVDLVGELGTIAARRRADDLANGGTNA